MRNLILKGLTSLLIPLLSFIASLVILSGQSLDWKTNLLYSLAILLASGILLEMFFVFSYAFKEGSYISVSILLNREQSSYARELADGEKKCLAWIDVIGDLGYKEDYLKLEHEMMTLRDEGIPMHSMLHVLENVNETIYRDTIHFCENMETGESLGSRILGEKMAEGLAKTFRLTKKEEPTTVA